jgi:teichuronic acid biosynthesis glycosyltransferase TuaH
MNKATLLFISLEPWDNIWRRNQFFAARMQKNLEVFYVQPVKPFYRWNPLKSKKYEDIKLIDIYKFFPDKYKFTAAWNQKLYLFQLKKKIKQSMEILWINDHKSYFLSEELSYSKLIYDITDDWTKAKHSIKEASLVNYADNYLCKQADTIIVCSKVLQERKASFGKKVVLIKNGVDFDFYQTTEQMPLKIKPPIIMYTGTVHEERVNFNLVLLLAKSYPQYSFVFVGPEYVYKYTKQKCKFLKNIHFLGAVPYEEIPKYMNSAEVLMVPHVETEFTQSLDPIKQYEYLCTNKPVISTAVSGFLDFKKYFTIANSINEFESQLKGLVEGTANLKIDARLKEAKKHSWDSRYKQVKEVLKI